MRQWVIILAFVAAAPLIAQEGGTSGTTSPDSNEDAIDPWADFEVGGPADGQYLPLSLGRDRTGLGLRLRGAMGWDDNLFKVDRDEESAPFMDGMGMAYVGSNLGLVSAGARGHIAGRLHFGEPDADQWDLKLGGFVKVPYNGGLGFGVSGDVLYQQLQTYEITGPLTRRDDLRASGAIGRAHVGYQAMFAIFELGVTGETTDFSEEQDVPSLDSWTIGIDLGVYLDIFGFIEIHPYVAFDYEWFRDQYDRRPDDGSRVEDEDLLQLLKFDYGADVRADFGFIEAAGRIYSERQDDAAAGFDRYWEYGIMGAADLNMTGAVRITVGGHAWTREYDERRELDDVAEGGQGTVHERFLRVYGELSWNFWEFVNIGARYTYERRTSDLDDGGYAANEVQVFLEIAW